MNEKTLAKYMVKILRKEKAHVQRHEDMASEGIPDLSVGWNKVNAWIELKCVASWPKRPTTTLKLPHLTPQQINWLVQRGRTGGNCFLLIKSNKDREYILLSWELLKLVKLGLPISRIKEVAVGIWKDRVNPEGFLKAIT